MTKNPSSPEERDPFEEYQKAADPSELERACLWRTAIGLQDVDGLRVSDFLIYVARMNIEGKITIQEAQDMIDAHYDKNSKIHPSVC